MANKAFEIQGATLRIGGVDLEAGTTGVVIPGITQATSYRVEEVDDTGDITGSSLNPDNVIAIDNAQFLFYSGAETPSVSYVAAQYIVELDNDGLPDKVEVDVGGTFTSADRTLAVAGNMWFADVPNATDNFNSSDWTQYAFRPKMRAGEIENIGGGGGASNLADLNDVSFGGEDNSLAPGDTIVYDGSNFVNARPTSNVGKLPFGLRIDTSTGYIVDLDTVIAEIDPNVMTKIFGDGNADDSHLTIGDLPFDIGFVGEQWGEVYVGSNSYVTFDGYSNNLGGLRDPRGLNNNPGLLISAADNSYQRVYTHTDGTSGDRRFSIRYEGTDNTSGTAGSPNIVWQITWYEANGNYVDLLILADARGVNGVSGLTDGSNWMMQDYNNSNVQRSVAMPWWMTNVQGFKFTSGYTIGDDGVATIDAGGGASTGDFTFTNGDIYNNAGTDARLYTNHTGDAMVQLRAKGAGGDSQWDFHSDGSLTFPDGSVQTVAYTGTSGSLTAGIWIAAGDDPGGSAISYSTDGSSWITRLDTLSGNLSFRRVAIGAEKIVYLYKDYGSNVSAIYYATSATETPVMATDTDNYLGNNVDWREINYLGGKFVAVGSYLFTGNIATVIDGIALPDMSRNTPRIEFSNKGFDFTNREITIHSADNPELNKTFWLAKNPADNFRDGIYDMYEVDQTTPAAITSSDFTNALVQAILDVDLASPIFAYSSNGTSWTYGSFDSILIDNLLGITPYGAISDVAYNGTGYLLPLIDDRWNSWNGNPLTIGPGAFYTTDLSVELGEGTWISGDTGLPGLFNNIAASANGDFYVSDDDYAVWTSSDAVSWTKYSITPSLIDALGWTPEGNNNGNDIDSAVGGTVGGTEYFVGTTNAGNVIATSDGGTTFIVSTPEPYTGTATLHDIGPALFDFNGSHQPQQWEKITITVANGDDTSWNGTYWVYSDSFDTIYTLYDSLEGAVIEGLTWTAPANPVNVVFSSGPDLGAIGVGNDECVVYSNEAGKLYKSSDLINWTTVFNNTEAFAINDIYYGEIAASTTNKLVNGTYNVSLNGDGTILFPSHTFNDGWNTQFTSRTIEFPQTNGSAALHTQDSQIENQMPDWMIIQGGRGYGNWNTNTSTPGGGITIQGGLGGEAESPTQGGEGGTVGLFGGAGQAGGNGGAVNIEGGQVQFGTGGTGGAVRIRGGSTNIGYYGAGDGGDVHLFGGLGTVNNGVVKISTSPDGENYPYQWTFGNDGSLGLAGFGTVKSLDGFFQSVNIVSPTYSQLQWTTPAGAEVADPNNTEEPLNWLYVEEQGIFLETGVNTSNTKSWAFRDNGKLRFPDGTHQTTAYVQEIVSIDGGGASVKYDSVYASVDGGFSSTRYGAATTVINGGNRLTETNDNNLDGGGA